MSRYIGTLPVPTADTRLTITKGKDSSNKMTYEIRLGGRWDWDSYVIGVIAKGVRGAGSSSIYGIATDRLDTYEVPSKVKAQIKTLADFSAFTNTHFYHDDNGTVFIGSAYWAKPIDQCRDSYCPNTKADDLTLIC